MPTEPGFATRRLANLQADDLYQSVSVGGDRPADGLLQPALLRRSHRPRASASPPLRRPAVAALPRRGPVQSGERLPRTRGQRPRAPAVASFLKRHVRRSDHWFRWGGDEFLILIWGTQQDATQMGAQLKAAFCALRDTSQLPPTLALSVGCAEVSPDTTDMASVISEADQRMYEDRNTRRRGTAYHSSSAKA